MYKTPIKKYLLLSCLSMLLSCKQETKSVTDVNKINHPMPTASESSLIISNYIYQNNGDTITLHFQTENEKVTGELIYQLKEKDRNTGKIEGTLKDNLLVAIYTFQSEGITSKKQVVFKFTDTGAIEGFGAMEEKDRAVVFKDIHALHYSDTMVMTKDN